MIHRGPQFLSQILRVTVQQSTDTLPAGQNTDRHPGPGMSLHVVENHSRAFLRRPGTGTAGTDVTVHTGKLGRRIYFYICLDQLSRHGSQEIQCTAKILYFIHRDYLHSALFTWLKYTDKTFTFQFDL